MERKAESIFVVDRRIDDIRSARETKVAFRVFRELLVERIEEKRELSAETVRRFAYGGEEVRLKVRQQLSEADGCEEVLRLVDMILGESYAPD